MRNNYKILIGLSIAVAAILIGWLVIKIERARLLRNLKLID